MQMLQIEAVETKHAAVSKHIGELTSTIVLPSLSLSPSPQDDS